MRPDERDAGFLWDRVDAAEAAAGFVAGKTFHDYLEDRMLRGPVERHIEIVREAAGNVSERFREAHPEIPWRQIVAQRHVLARGYADIKHRLIWNVATAHLPTRIEAHSTPHPTGA
ncbi:MAG: DUF86 domain-containing protein [Planctomycetota bacterium]